MNLLTPITITDAILSSSTVAEPAAGEIAWVSGGTYALGDLRIRATTHRIYACVLAHTGIATLPESDPTRWLEKSPTLRWAAFDSYVSTASTATTSLTYVLRPGFCNTVAFYGLVGLALQLTIRDGPGGTIAYTLTDDLTAPFSGFYELLTGKPRQRDKVFYKALPLLPDPEITITISSTAGAPVAVGMIVLGDLAPLIDDSIWGGTEFGPTVEPTTYSYIKTNTDGTLQIVKRNATTNMTASVVMPTRAANYALNAVTQVLDVPCAWIATDTSGYEGLNVFGLGSGKLAYPEGYVRFDLRILGTI